MGHEHLIAECDVSLRGTCNFSARIEERAALADC